TSLIFTRPMARILPGKPPAADREPQAGAGVQPLTGRNPKTPGPPLIGGVLPVNKARAVGPGARDAIPGTELRRTRTGPLPALHNFASNGIATLSANGILNVGSLKMDGSSANVVFGSAGNAGVVVVGGPGSQAMATTTTIDVAFGTLRNG